MIKHQLLISLAFGDNLIIQALFIREDTMDENERGIVNMVIYHDTRIMFTADIGFETEHMMIEQLPLQYLRADILKVAHHGSRFSSSSEFMQAVSPSYAVISVGARNMFGHPTQAAMDNILATGARIMRTDEYGHIRFVLDETGIRER